MAGGFTIRHDEEPERAFDVWVLVRKSLGLRGFGINMVELPQGGSIPEHDEMGRDQVGAAAAAVRHRRGP